MLQNKTSIKQKIIWYKNGTHDKKIQKKPSNLMEVTEHK